MPPYAPTPVYSVALRTDGGVLIGGSFTNVNNIIRNHIAQLHGDGSVDQSFDGGSEVGNAIRALALQADGKIIIGGSFKAVNGLVCNSIARLTVNGYLDTTFSAGTGLTDVDPNDLPAARAI